MKHYYLGILFLLLSATLPAQDKDLEQEILQYSETKSDLISKGRRLLTDKFIEGDITKVREVKDYLMNEVEDENYTALYPGELWMIMYWTGEYETLLNSLMQLDERAMARYSTTIPPPRDFLYPKLVELSWEYLERLEDNILDSELDLARKDFLILHLNYMISGEPLFKLSQEEVNKMADLYLETHSASPYEEYVRNNIRFQYVPRNWGMGFEFFTGYGLLTGGLSEYYTNNIPLGVAFDVEYKKITLYLRNYIGFGKTKIDREFASGIWDEGSASLTFLPEASIGFAIAENDKLKLSPFIGIGATGITATDADIEKYPELEDAQVGFSTAYTLGVNLDLKLGWDAGHYISGIQQDKSYWFLRLRYGYTIPQLNTPGHTGNIHHITLGIGGVTRGMKREI